MSLAIKFYFTASMLNMFRTLIHPSSGACDFSIVSPHWLCVLVSMCVGVSVWLGWGGIRVAGWSLSHGYCVVNTFFRQPDDGLHTGPKHVVVYYILLLTVILLCSWLCIYRYTHYSFCIIDLTQRGWHTLSQTTCFNDEIVTSNCYFIRRITINHRIIGRTSMSIWWY